MGARQISPLAASAMKLVGKLGVERAAAAG
jgi:hypothetical protein